MACGMLENKVVGLDELVKSVRNPGQQPFGADGKLETGSTGSSGGQVGGSSGGSGNGQNGALGAASVIRARVGWSLMLAVTVAYLQ